MSVSEVRFCPQCGSAGVDYSSLACGESHCAGCGFRGTQEDLLVVPIAHEFHDAEHVLREKMNDLRRLLSAELGLPYLKFLLKWGYLDGDLESPVATLDRKLLSRYLAAIAHSILKGLIAERRKIELERVGRRTNESN